MCQNDDIADTMAALRWDLPTVTIDEGARSSNSGALLHDDAALGHATQRITGARPAWG